MTTEQDRTPWMMVKAVIHHDLVKLQFLRSLVRKNQLTQAEFKSSQRYYLGEMLDLRTKDPNITYAEAQGLVEDHNARNYERDQKLRMGNVNVKH